MNSNSPSESTEANVDVTEVPAEPEIDVTAPAASASESPISELGDDADRDEGDIAADFLEELLDIADLDGDLDIEVRQDRTYVSVETSDENSNLRVLSERNVVDALQQLTRLAVQAETGEPSRLILDIAGSREARKNELRELVDRAIARIAEGATSAALPPMSSYERKLVHDIAADLGYSSESEGDGPKRHTVIRKAADS